VRWHSALSFALCTHLKHDGLKIHSHLKDGVATYTFSANGKELEMKISERDVELCENPREFLRKTVGNVVTKLGLER
jgi:hypothetical protein